MGHAQKAKTAAQAGTNATTTILQSQRTSSQATAHPIVHEGLLTSPQEGLVIGNGDLAASIQIYSHELKLNLGKNDVWDVRHDSPTITEDIAITQDELISYVREHGVVTPEFLFKPGKPGDPDIFYSARTIAAYLMDRLN